MVVCEERTSPKERWSLSLILVISRGCLREIMVNTNMARCESPSSPNEILLAEFCLAEPNKRCLGWEGSDF